MKYKIILPKEEQTKCYCGHTSYCDCGTLEELSEVQKKSLKEHQEFIGKTDSKTLDLLMSEFDSEEELVKFIKSDPTLSVMMREAMRNNCKKEEPKQDWYCPKCQSYVSSESVTFEETHQICNTSVVIEEPKQETTLEEHNYLTGFMNQFEEGEEHQELSNEDWTVSQFLKWLKLNNFVIIKGKQEFEEWFIKNKK